MRSDLLNSRHVKIAAVVLAGISAVAIAAIAVIRLQTFRENDATINNSASVAPPRVPSVPASIPSCSDKPDLSDDRNENIPQDPEQISAEDLPVVEVAPFTVKWLPKPKKLSETGAPSVLSEGLGDSYFKMGETSTGSEVLYTVGLRGMGELQLERWLKTPAGEHIFLEAQSHIAEDLSLEADLFSKGMLAKDVRSNVIPGVDVPSEFSHSGMKWKREGGTMFFRDITPLDDEDVPDVYLASLPFGKLYSKEMLGEVDIDLGKVNYFVRTEDGIFLSYSLDDGRADDGTILADWDSSHDALGQMSFTSNIHDGKCGFSNENRYYPEKGEMKKYEKVGELIAGGTLFLMTKKNNSIVDTLYKDVENSLKPSTPREDFSRHVTVLLSPDPFGRGYLFYYSIDDPELTSMAECGKPVIYLYPERATDVSVKVGAFITQSEPEYRSGWSVTAQPNGTLRDGNGKTWGSLYWEGTGFGTYPAIREGRVIPQSRIREEITRDLVALGLNEREREDFLEFWMPHMPDDPFVRITWFSTDEMNSLAPLQISPRPDTMIRIFLDYSGQATPRTDLQPQVLTSVPREGFTLVEWGGLIHTAGTKR